MGNENCRAGKWQRRDSRSPCLASPCLKPSILFSVHLGSTALPLPAHSGACRGHVGSSQWMHILTAPGSAAGLPCRCSRSWLSWHPPCPHRQHRQQSSTFLRPAQTAGGYCPPALPSWPTATHRACHGAAGPGRWGLTRLQGEEGAQSRRLQPCAWSLAGL